MGLGHLPTWMTDRQEREGVGVKMLALGNLSRRPDVDWVMQVALLVVTLHALGVSSSMATDRQEEVARLWVETVRAAEELATTAQAEGLDDEAVHRLREYLEVQVQGDRALLQKYWEGRIRYSQWVGRAFWVEGPKSDLEKQLAVELPGAERLDQALAVYVEARNRALRSGGQGDCYFHLWARVEPVGAKGPARVVVGNHSPGCRNLGSSVAIRSAHWVSEAEEPLPWSGPLPGISVRLEDGSIEVTPASAIAHTLDSVPETDLTFERGLLRLGDSMPVLLPLPSPGDEDPVLEVEIIVVRGVDLESPILFPSRAAGPVTVFRAGERDPDPDLAGLAFVVWKEGVQLETVRVQLPIRVSTDRE